MSCPKGVLSLRGDLKRPYDYDMEVVQLTTNAQLLEQQRLKIADSSKQMQQDDLKIPLKMMGALQAPKETHLKMIDLLTRDPSKTTTISAELNQAKEDMLTNFYRTRKIFSHGS